MTVTITPFWLAFGFLVLGFVGGWMTVLAYAMVMLQRGKRRESVEP